MVRQALGLTRDNFYLLGQSWGGILAMEYALAHQQNLKGLIISNMVASIPKYNEYAQKGAQFGLVKGLPASWIYDPEGRLVKKHLGKLSPAQLAHARVDLEGHTAPGSDSCGSPPSTSKSSPETAMPSGITAALIPVRTPGVEIGRRHFPLNIPFQNGPTRGRDVFVPLDAIIGDMAAGRYSDMHLAAFLSACAGGRMDVQETIDLLRIVSAGPAPALSPPATRPGGLQPELLQAFVNQRCSQNSAGTVAL